MRTLWHPPVDEIQLVNVMNALSDPLRLELLAALADDEWHGCGEREFGVSKSTMSHHFRTLREAGVTEARDVGRTREIRLRRADLDVRFPGLLDAVLESLPADQPVRADRR